MRTEFKEITRKKSVNTFCKQCNSKLRRIASDYQTENPFNKNSKGELDPNLLTV